MFGDKKTMRHVYRLPPCPLYDVEGMESWLTDMAKGGLLLCRDGFFAGAASFERTYPQSMIYRLEAAQKNTSMWADDGGEPDEEAVEISEKYGWEYVAKCGDFYIYRTSDPAARELNTDPAVQALALNAVRKRQRGAVISSLLLAVVYPIIAIRGNFLLTMINIGTWFFLYGMALLFWLFSASVVRAVHLGRLRRKLLDDGEIDHRKDWRKRASVYFAGRVLRAALIVIWICMLLQKWSVSIADEDKVPLYSYKEDPPFATIADLLPDGEYIEKDFMNTNKIREWSDWLSIYNVDWSEIAAIRRPDGTDLSGGLYADYHEAINPWIAKRIAHEYLRMDKRSKDYEPLEFDPEPLDVDFAVCYMGSIHMPTVILQDGNKVIHASFYQTSQTYTMPLEEWVGILAESIK